MRQALPRLRLPGDLIHAPDPFLEMAQTRPSGPVGMILHHVLDGCDGAIDVEGVALVGYRQVKNATLPQHTDKVADGADRVLTVLEEVVGDDEILCASATVDSFSPSSTMLMSTRWADASSGYCRRNSATGRRSTYRTRAARGTLRGEWSAPILRPSPRR